jgi:hypothetical protein
MTVANPVFQNTKIRSKKKYRLKRKVRRRFILFSVIVMVAFILYFPVSRKIDRFLHPRNVGKVEVTRYRDLNAFHLKHAKAGGIDGFKTEAEFHEKMAELVDDEKLIKIENSRYFILEKLTHSHPYLTPEAEQLLRDIGKRFHKKLDEKELGKYRYKISSLLRTGESQKKLSRSNGNASPNTSHLYATTFDITYGSVIKNPLPWVEVEVVHGPAIQALSDAIGELRREGRCVVITERKERCFHVTAVN